MATEDEEQATETGDENVGISEPALHTVAGYSAVAGLCPLIPIPFVDDLIIVRVRRRLAQKICAQHDFYLSVESAKTLTSRESKLLSGALKTMILWPVKKIIRKLVYVLAIKSCADVAAEVFHEGWLISRALEAEYVSTETLARGNRRALVRLRDAIVATQDEIDPKVTRQAMHSAFGVGREVLGPLLESMRGVLSRETDEEERLDAAEREAAPITERIESELRAYWVLGPDLDAALRRHLDRTASSGS